MGMVWIMMGLMSICVFFFGEARCEAIGWNWFYHEWKRPAGHAINEHLLLLYSRRVLLSWRYSPHALHKRCKSPGQ